MDDESSLSPRMSQFFLLLHHIDLFSPLISYFGSYDSEQRLMTDANALLAWGRSLVAARRGGGEATSAPHPVHQRNGTVGHQYHQQHYDASVGGSACNSSRVSTSGDSSADPIELLEDDRRPAAVPLHSHSHTAAAISSAATHQRSKQHLQQNASGGAVEAPFEASESHWQRLDRLGGGGDSQLVSPTAATGGGGGGGGKRTVKHKIEDVQGGGTHTHEGQSPLPATVSSSQAAASNVQPPRRRAQTMVTSTQKVTSSASPTMSAAVQHQLLALKNDESLLQRQVESERRHVEDLLTMQQRNHEEFTQREEELALELRTLPQTLEEAARRRHARLLHDRSLVQEDDLSKLEEVLWTIESQTESLREKEAQCGQDVAELASGIQCCGPVAEEFTASILQTSSALRRVVPVMEDVRRLVLDGYNGSARRTTKEGASYNSSYGDVPLAIAHIIPSELDLQRELLAMRTLNSDADTIYSNANNNGSGDAEALLASLRFGVHVHRALIPAFLGDVSTMSSALAHEQSQRFKDAEQRLDEATKQLDFQRITMDDAHQALQELLRERSALDDDILSMEQHAATTKLLLERESELRSTDNDKKAVLVKRRSELESEQHRLKERITAASSQIRAEQVECNKFKQLAEGATRRCEESRQSARLHRTQHDSIEAEFVVLQKHWRSLTSQQEELSKESERLVERLGTQKHRLVSLRTTATEMDQKCYEAETRSKLLKQETTQLNSQLEDVGRQRQSVTTLLDSLYDAISAHASEKLASLQRIQQLEEELRQQKLNQQDADEELDVARAVLLHQEEHREGNVVKSSRSGGVGGAGAGVGLLSDDDRKLFLEGEDEPDAHRPPRSSANAAAATSAGRVRQWRSSSRSTEPSPRSTYAEVGLLPPNQLEEVAPPSSWIHMAPTSTNAPLIVAPQPRYFQRDLEALHATRERGRQALMDFVNDNEEHQHSSSDTNDDELPPPEDDAPNYPQHPRVQSWVEAPTTFLPSRRDLNTHSSAPHSRSSSAFSSAPSSSEHYNDTATARYRNAHHAAVNIGPAMALPDEEPPFMKGASQQYVTLNRAGATPSDHPANRKDPQQYHPQEPPLRHHVDPIAPPSRQQVSNTGPYVAPHPTTTTTSGSAATADRGSSNSLLRERLSMMQSNLQRAVADHSTARKKPFR